MLKMPNIGGAEVFSMLLDDIPRTRWHELLGVSDRTIRRWRTGDCPVPRAAVQAVFWHTRWGDSVIQSEYGFELRTLRGLAGCSTGATLRRVRGLAAANSGGLAAVPRQSLAAASDAAR